MSGFDTEEIIRMAQEAGWGFNNSRSSEFVKAQLKFAELVAAAEREACAEVCEEVYNDGRYASKFCLYCADAIRKRGNDAA
jgi:hypothetical protein